MTNLTTDNLRARSALAAAGALSGSHQLLAFQGSDTAVLATLTALANFVASATAGSSLQGYDADLAAIAALASAADKLPYATGVGTWALTDLTPTARTLLAASSARAMAAILGVPYVAGKSGTAAPPLTGTTAETVLATVTLPPLNAQSQIRVQSLWTCTNNANTKNARIRLGGLSGAAFLAVPMSSAPTGEFERRIANRGATNSQIAYTSATSGSFAVVAGAPSTGAIDTSVSQDLVFTGQLANAADTLTLETFLVEILF